MTKNETLKHTHTKKNTQSDKTHNTKKHNPTHTILNKNQQPFFKQKTIQKHNT